MDKHETSEVGSYPEITEDREEATEALRRGYLAEFRARGGVVSLGLPPIPAVAEPNAGAALVSALASAESAVRELVRLRGGDPSADLKIEVRAITWREGPGYAAGVRDIGGTPADTSSGPYQATRDDALNMLARWARSRVEHEAAGRVVHQPATGAKALWLLAEAAVLVATSGPCGKLTIELLSRSFDPDKIVRVTQENGPQSEDEQDDEFPVTVWQGPLREWCAAVREAANRPSFPPGGWAAGPYERAWSGDTG